MSDNSVELDFLAGVRVVDFTQFEAGPSCTEALAWLGAEVVKIENPSPAIPVGDCAPANPMTIRITSTVQREQEVDHVEPEGAARDWRWSRTCCARPTSPWRTWHPARSSVSASATTRCKKLNPGIIYCQVKGFGEGSPYETNLAFDMIAQATGGTISVTGEKGRQPVKPGLSLGDTGTGMTMAITILGALRKRDKTGEGIVCRWRCRTRCCTTCAPTSRPRRAPVRRWSVTARARAADQRAIRTVSVRAGRPERLCLDHDQPRQSGALGPAVQGDGTRGSDQRSALRHAGVACEERCGTGSDHPGMDKHAHQA